MSDCRKCEALRYEHMGETHTAHCTDSSRTPRGETRRVLLVSRAVDLEAMQTAIPTPAWCENKKRPLR